MLVSLARYHKAIAWCLMGLFYLEFVLSPVAAYAAGTPLPAWMKKTSYGRDISYLHNAVPLPIFGPADTRAAAKPATAFGTGPGQPEMAAFTSVSSANMVDLFSGDFSYNIPLLDVGGYPVNLAYRAGISMDQDASWVGLGWNVNPGTISRNMRGLPDDFNGRYDTVKKIMSVKDNRSIGVTGGLDAELAGYPKSTKDGQKKTDSAGGSSGLVLGASLGVVYNSYRGYGLEVGVNASINSGKPGMGALSGGLSITNSSMDGLTMAPSLSTKLWQYEAVNNVTSTGSLSISSSYNTRSGIRGMQLGLGMTNSKREVKNGKSGTRSFTGTQVVPITFNSPSYTPGIAMPYTSRQVSFSGKVGITKKTLTKNYYISGYVSNQFIANADTLQELPAYGYLHYTTGVKNKASLLDFNREKELPYREKPAIAHIAIPAYTYDAFSITGEGTGGMFRAYRSDIGFVYDHYMRTKDESGRLGVEVGLGDLWHAGVDVNLNRVITETGPWIKDNVIAHSIGFRRDTADFQSVYFRNPGEKSINDKAFYETLGGDDVVAVGLSQSSIHSPIITASSFLTRFRNGRKVGELPVNARNAVKQERDKRTQVISYLTAQEATVAGLSKYIEYHQLNTFDNIPCEDPVFNVDPLFGKGLKRRFYKNMKLRGTEFHGLPDGHDGQVAFDFGREIPWMAPEIKQDNKFSATWRGRVKAPRNGAYTFYTTSDDGARLWINDSLIIDHWYPRMRKHGRLEGRVNLEAGKMYDIRLDYFDEQGLGYILLEWKLPMSTLIDTIAQPFLFPPLDKDTVAQDNLVREMRVNRFRKASHISEINVLNSDGRRYVYGIPVYNLQQKELTFAVNKGNGSTATGLVQYTPGQDNTTQNNQGRDNYYNSEEVPAYAHSFLLTGILSADYSDITGNGISDDDIGDAVKFNYTKTAGITHPYQWRTPAVENAAAYDEGLKTEERDDKGNYIYGEKELWYLHSIESKTMVAAFILENRDDLPAYAENGKKIASHATKRLKEIRLYSKADFINKGAGARPVKTVHFAYSYRLCPGAYGPGTGKLTLDSLWFTYNGNKKGKQNPYVFHYNSHNPAYHLQHNDRWGTYKDPAQNPGSTTGNINRNADYPYALQDSAQAAHNAAAWNLDSIRLPSGGALKVQYESDDYAWVQNKRAAQLFRVLGTGLSNDYSKMSTDLYTKTRFSDAEDHRYVFISIPQPVNSLEELYHQYLAGIEKLYFKISVEVRPGKGYEFVPCYANIEDNNYGIVNSQVIWLKIAGISLNGLSGGSYSPLVKAATQFVRLNLPGVAYPGSETGDAVDLEEAINMLHSLAKNKADMFKSFDRIAREDYLGKRMDPTRSYVRLNNPSLKKYGGGHRVKRIIVYDHWDKMAKKPGQDPVKPAVYGQEYTYTAPWPVNKDTVVGSSGVAVWEPAGGAEENPFRVPVEYVERIAPLGPVTMGYTEMPLGESFFPGASVGYSSVRVRTINFKNRKSANGWEETKFYTAYDYPVYVDKSILDGGTKKRYKPTLDNLLRIDARHYLALSQGFKIELNDMHGKLRSQATYAETNSSTPVSYSEQFYRTDTTVPGYRRLSNQVMVMKPNGSIDTAALIGKDVELMVDMRSQISVTHGVNLPLNTDAFLIPATPPTFLLPIALSLLQREENRYHSAATTKIIQRYGILDSAIQIDKGSRISTRDLLYDSETGNVLMTRTQNEFNDPVYNFTYPSHWAYDGMGLAYKNIDAVLYNVTIREGRIRNMTPGQERLFSSGDEILVAGRNVVQNLPFCDLDQLATFPDYNKIWAVDSSVLYGGTHSIYFIDRWGKPYNGDSATLRIIRSGRRNVLGAVGSITSLKPMLVKNAQGDYTIVVNDSSQVIAASAGEFRQDWKIDNVLRKQPRVDCIPRPQPTGNVACVKDGSNNHTGYQQITMVDTNPNSETYNDTTYVYRQNCYECPLPPKWIAQDTFRCATDSVGNNLGFRWRGELDTASCSQTFRQYRWQLNAGADCATCPKPANWQYIAGDSCERNWYDTNHTGYVLRKQRDIDPCSGSYDSVRWVRDSMDCEICPRPASWWSLNEIRCERINGVKTGYRESLQVNTQTCGDSAQQFRWVKIPTLFCDSCAPPPNWKPVGSPVCETAGGSTSTLKATNTAQVMVPVYTGYQLQQYIDSSACGNLATKWERTYNPTACPLPPPPCSESCTGEGLKCIDEVCTGGTAYYGCPEQINQYTYRTPYWYVWPDNTVSQIYYCINSNPQWCPYDGSCSIESLSAGSTNDSTNNLEKQSLLNATKADDIVLSNRAVLSAERIATVMQDSLALTEQATQAIKAINISLARKKVFSRKLNDHADQYLQAIRNIEATRDELYKQQLTPEQYKVYLKKKGLVYRSLY